MHPSKIVTLAVGRALPWIDQRSIILDADFLYFLLISRMVLLSKRKLPDNLQVDLLLGSRLAFTTIHRPPSRKIISLPQNDFSSCHCNGLLRLIVAVFGSPCSELGATGRSECGRLDALEGGVSAEDNSWGPSGCFGCLWSLLQEAAYPATCPHCEQSKTLRLGGSLKSYLSNQSRAEFGGVKRGNRGKEGTRKQQILVQNCVK